MKVIVAGCRWITALPFVDRAIRESGFHVTEVVSGGADGVDHLGEVWAGTHEVPLRRFPAKWSEHGKKAGPMRNEEMARYADALVAVWDGQSRGTADMIRRATSHGLKVHVDRIPAPRGVHGGGGREP